jgi:uncharacterized membrane protein YkvA (DUF1232 family)
MRRIYQNARGLSGGRPMLIFLQMEPPRKSAGRELVIFDPAKLKADEAKVSRSFWAKLRRALAAIPFAEDLVAARHAAADPATPLHVKAILMGALAYFIMPADVIPDFIALLGYTDDAAVLLAAIRAVSPHIKPAHRAQARAWLAKQRR